VGSLPVMRQSAVPRGGLKWRDWPYMSESEFYITRKIGALWRSGVRIRRLEFRVAPKFRVNRRLEAALSALSARQECLYSWTAHMLPSGSGKKQ
jgi:hypothetical protein